MKSLLAVLVFVGAAFSQQTVLRGPTNMGGGGGGGGGGNVSTGSVLVTNQLILGAGSTNVTNLGTLGTSTTVLHGNAAGAPTFGPLDLSAEVTGNLGVSHLNSGTGASSTTAYFGDGTWKSPFAPAGIPNSTGTGWSTSYLVNGNGASVQLFTGSTTTGDCGQFDANGNLTDAGAPCGASISYPGAGVAVSTGSAWTTSLTAPSGALVGTSDTQTLTNKTVDGVSPTTFGFLDPTSSVQTQLNALAPKASPTFTGTITSPITGSVQCLHVNSSGVISGTASDCGTSTMVWPSAAGIAVYGGSNNWLSSLTAPSGTIVGTSDTQTLTNKTLTAPVVNSATFGTGATFSFVTGSNQCLQVNSAGIVSGAGSPCGTSGMVWPAGSGIPVVVSGSSWGTTKAAPTGTIVGTTDSQTLTNKSIDGSEVNTGTVPVAQIPTTIPRTIASGSKALATSSIAAGACVTTSVTAAGVLTTDVVDWTPNGSLKAVTGYVPSSGGGLSIAAYATAGGVSFDNCNWTSSPVTPGAVTVNYAVRR